MKIVVVNRPRSSGTRAVFTKTIMGTVPVNESGLTEDATGTVISVVKQTPGAISYAAMGSTRGSGINELSVDGVAPTDENIYTGKYPVWSYEHMFTNGPATGEIAAFHRVRVEPLGAGEEGRFPSYSRHEGHRDRPLIAPVPPPEHRRG